MRTYQTTPLMMLMALLPARLLFGEGDPIPGARVRVTAAAATNQDGGDRSRERRIQGKLLALDEATMTIETEGQPRPIVVPRPEIKKLEVSMRPSRKGRAALIGAGAGALSRTNSRQQTGRVASNGRPIRRQSALPTGDVEMAGKRPWTRPCWTPLPSAATPPEHGHSPILGGCDDSAPSFRGDLIRRSRL